MKKLIIGLFLSLLLMGSGYADDLISSQTFDVMGTATTTAVTTIYLPNKISNNIIVHNDNTTSGQDLYIDFMGYKTLSTISLEAATGRTGSGTSEALATIGGTILKAGEYIIENDFKTSQIGLLSKSGSIAYRVHIVY